MQDNTTVQELERKWETSRWQGVKRPYTAKDVIRLRRSLKIEYTLARVGSEKLWHLLKTEPYVATFGAMTGSQAVQMVKGGLKAIYLSGWQTAADSNEAGQTYPDQSLYPSNSVPTVIRRLNNALIRADEIEHAENGTTKRDWYVPIVADAEAGFGGPLHAFELTKAFIEAGAAGIHFEDQLSSEKKCGHLGGKVLVPTTQFVRTLIAARLAADILDVPIVLIARTDALTAGLITSDIDPYDHPFIKQEERTIEGFYRVKCGLEAAIHRALAYAPYCDMLWFETSEPDLEQASQFAKAIQETFPNKLLAYNCSSSFNWRLKLSPDTISSFQQRLGEMGYKFQFITLAGWHLVNYFTFDLAKKYKEKGMSAYVELQQQELKAEQEGYTAVKHQQEVGTGYFDNVLLTITGGCVSTTALKSSTEEQQFNSLNC